MTTLKTQVANYLISKENNINDINKMIELHFEDAKRLENIKSISNYIRKIY